MSSRSEGKPGRGHGIRGASPVSGVRRPPRRRPHTLYGRIGGLEVRLVRERGEIRAAQHLRYRVFYEELAAAPSLLSSLRRRDEDPYDAVCDHLIVYDTARRVQTSSRGPVSRRPEAVGTYRVLRQDVARRSIGFYSQGEYDVAPLVAARSPGYRFMELGRSCVLGPYRTRRTIELLWHGLWGYARQHRIDVMIGCASFEGTDPAAHAMALSYLHHTRLAPPAWRARAHDRLHVPMDMVAAERVDARHAIRQLPPLIRAYLRLGAWVGDGAVIDRPFGTTDVLIILPVENIDPRYFGYFGAPHAPGQPAASLDLDAAGAGVSAGAR